MGDAFDDLLSSLDGLGPNNGSYDDGSYSAAPVEVSEPVEDYPPTTYADLSEEQEVSVYVPTPPPPAPAPPRASPAVAHHGHAAAGGGGGYGGGASYGGGGGGGGNACGKCGSSVGGEHIKAMDRLWHVQHFTCGRCNRELRGGAFFVHDGQPHCTSCIENLHPCSKCGRGITGQYVYSDQGQKWHAECVDRRNCAKCHQHVNETEISALNQHWHPHCFVCHRCNVQLVGNFVVKENKPLCQNCSHAARPLCHRCGQALSGEYVTFKGENLHHNCHTCSHCRRPLGVTGFYEIHGQPRCENCKSL